MKLCIKTLYNGKSAKEGFPIVFETSESPSGPMNFISKCNFLNNYVKNSKRPQKEPNVAVK